MTRFFRTAGGIVLALIGFATTIAAIVLSRGAPFT